MNGQVTWLFVAIAVAVMIVAFVWLFLRRRRSEQLRSRFGPEYERTVRQVGDVAKAEATLAARAHRVDRLAIRRLTPDDQARFADAWRRLQERFVDDPHGAIDEANRLVGEVMHARGYPVGDFELGSSRVDLQACKLEYSIVSPK